jgi:hypothetical protein
VRKEIVEAEFLAAFKVERMEDLPLASVLDAFAWIDS